MKCVELTGNDIFYTESVIQLVDGVKAGDKSDYDFDWIWKFNR